MFELTGNVRQSRDTRAPSPKLKKDGSAYPWRMFFDDNSKIVDADTLAELIEQLLPGYMELDELGQAEARRRHVAQVAFNLKANILGGLSYEEQESLSEWEFEVLSSDEPLEKVYPLGTIRNSDSEDEDESILGELWSSDVPLVLEEENFIPFTTVMPPVSSYGDYKLVPNIIRLASSSEEKYLESLARVGIITYGSPRTQPTESLR